MIYDGQALLVVRDDQGEDVLLIDSTEDSQDILGFMSFVLVVILSLNAFVSFGKKWVGTSMRSSQCGRLHWRPAISHLYEFKQVFTSCYMGMLQHCFLETPDSFWYLCDTIHQRSIKPTLQTCMCLRGRGSVGVRPCHCHWAEVACCAVWVCGDECWLRKQRDWVCVRHMATVTALGPDALVTLSMSKKAVLRWKTTCGCDSMRPNPR